jgi:hypothetical protein
MAAMVSRTSLFTDTLATVKDGYVMPRLWAECRAAMSTPTD